MWGAFWDKFFDSERWNKHRNRMLEGVMTAHDGRKWVDFPSVPDERPVWDWLRSIETRFLAEAPHQLYTTASANQFKERKGEMDISLQVRKRKDSGVFEYKDVLV